MHKGLSYVPMSPKHAERLLYNSILEHSGFLNHNINCKTATDEISKTYLSLCSSFWWTSEKKGKKEIVAINNLTIHEPSVERFMTVGIVNRNLDIKNSRIRT